jgi:hypothetical protein
VKDGKVTAFIPDANPDPNSGPGAGTSAAEGVAADARGNIYGRKRSARAQEIRVKK